MTRERETHNCSLFFFSLRSGVFGYKCSLNSKKWRERVFGPILWTIGETCCIYIYVLLGIVPLHYKA